MTDSFELLTGGITSVYNSIQKIKKLSMSEIGLKGVHAMCIYYLYTTPDGLTAAELCIRCREDKAAISRILSELESFEMITYQQAGPQESRKYRAKAVLTDKGRAYAGQVSELIRQAVDAGRNGLTMEETKTFYRVLYHISDNLEQLISVLEEKGQENS